MKNILNRICAMFLLMMLVIVSSEAIHTDRPQEVNATTSEAVIELSKESKLYMDTMTQYRTVSSDKKRNPDGWAYSDEFAGVWYDKEGKLNIGETKEV